MRYRKCAICNCSRVYDFDCVIIFASYGNALNTLSVIVYINFSVGIVYLESECRVGKFNRIRAEILS